MSPDTDRFAHLTVAPAHPRSQSATCITAPVSLGRERLGYDSPRQLSRPGTCSTHIHARNSIPVTREADSASARPGQPPGLAEHERHAWQGLAPAALAALHFPSQRDTCAVVVVVRPRLCVPSRVLSRRDRGRMGRDGVRRDRPRSRRASSPGRSQPRGGHGHDVWRVEHESAGLPASCRCRGRCSALVHCFRGRSASE